MSTLQNLQGDKNPRNESILSAACTDTTTLTGRISGPGSLTCCSWSTQSTDPRGQLTRYNPPGYYRSLVTCPRLFSLCRVYTGLRSTHWPTRSSSRQQLTSRYRVEGLRQQLTNANSPSAYNFFREQFHCMGTEHFLRFKLSFLSIRNLNSDSQTHETKPGRR